jgi:hypothetical protein
MSTLEQAIAEVHRRGCLVHNLFQRMDGGGWQANVRKADPAHLHAMDYAIAATPAAALKYALAELDKTGGAAVQGTRPKPKAKPPAPPPADDDDLIG